MHATTKPNSVLMHLLPGLAIFAHRYYTPPALRGWRGLLRIVSDQTAAVMVNGSAGQWTATSGGASLAAHAPPALLPRPHSLWSWLVVAPLLFYLTWQLFYFVVVQVVFRDVIKQGGYDTVRA